MHPSQLHSRASVDCCCTTQVVSEWQSEHTTELGNAALLHMAMSRQGVIHRMLDAKLMRSAPRLQHGQHVIIGYTHTPLHNLRLFMVLSRLALQGRLIMSWHLSAFRGLQIGLA